MVGMDDKPSRMPVEPGSWQFTLRRLLLVLGFVACACTVVGWIYQDLVAARWAKLIDKLGILLLSLVMMGGFLGAAVRTLAGKARVGAVRGIIAVVVVRRGNLGHQGTRVGRQTGREIIGRKSRPDIERQKTDGQSRVIAIDEITCGCDGGAGQLRAGRPNARRDGRAAGKYHPIRLDVRRG